MSALNGNLAEDGRINQGVSLLVSINQILPSV
jgi:hypothetical protein